MQNLLRRLLAIVAVLITLGLAWLGGTTTAAAAVLGLIAGVSIAYGIPEVRTAVSASRSDADPRAIGGAIIAVIALLILVLRPATPPAAAIAGLGVGIGALVVFVPPPRET